MTVTKKMLKQLSSRLGHVTRAKKELDAQAAFSTDNPSEVGIQHLTKALDRYNEAISFFEQKAREICDEADETVEVECTAVKRVEEQLDDLIEEKAEFTQMICNIISNSKPQARARARAPAQAEGEAKPKLCSDLKPFQLKCESPHNEKRSWKEAFQAYYEASRLDMYSLKEQHQFFFNCLALALRSRIKENDNYRGDLNVFGAQGEVTLETILDAEFDLSDPLFNRRYDFFTYMQAQGQTFSNYMLKLKQKADECELHRLTQEELMVFRCITGVSEKELQSRFMKLGDPSLADIKKEVRTFEAGKKALSVMEKDKAKAAVAHTSQPNTGAKPKVQVPKSIQGKCFTCGSSDHVKQQCNKKPDEVSCNICKRKGHLPKGWCRVRIEREEKEAAKARQATSEDGASAEPAAVVESHTANRVLSADEGDLDEIDLTAICYGAVAKGATSESTPKLPLTFVDEATEATFTYETTPDTGATRSVFAADVSKRFKLGLRPTKCKLYNASGKEMKVVGAVVVKVADHYIKGLVSPDLNEEILIAWHDLRDLGVIPTNFPALPSREESAHLAKVADEASLKVEALKKKFDTVLQDELDPNSAMSGPPMKIHLRKDVKIRPMKMTSARKIPLHMQKAADEAVQALLKAGVIEPVKEPSEWVSPGHFVKKPNGSARLVVDFTALNQIVERPIHPFATGMDIISSLKPTSRWFAKLDAVSGYNQIELDDESAKLTTFLIPQGRYLWRRCVMGMNASGDEWCRRSDEAFEGLGDWFHKLVDDILIEAETLDQLMERLEATLERARKIKMRLSIKKLEVGQSVNFAGHIVTAEGTRPDPEKLEAITLFRSPRNTTDIRSFSGMANQLSNFHPDLAHMTVHMRKLLQKNVAWQWLPEHETEFQNAKRFLCSDVVVKPFDPDLKTELLTDASRLNGLGFCLIQREKDGRNRLITCGSCALTPTQQRYATIELEMLAVQWALQKCDFWVAGIKKEMLLVLVDHRPLLGVFKKPLFEITNPRLQRMRCKITGYTFEIDWRAGKQHQIADCLSRYPVWDAKEDDEDEIIVACVRSAVSKAVAKQNKNLELRDFFEAAHKCNEYQAIVAALREGKAVENLPSAHPARAFRDVWDQLSLFGCGQGQIILLDGRRVVVPAPARPRVLQLLHVSHQGVVKTKQLAKRFYFWPQMNLALKNLVDGCRLCIQFSASQPREKFLEAEHPAEPMEAVGCDLFEAAGNHYVVLVDQYSGFLWVEKLRNQSTAEVTKHLTKWFRTFGFCQRLRSDGGPCFKSDAFREFCEKFSIVHEKSSAYFPQSNGLSEAGVKNAKKLLLKTLQEGSDFEEALSEFRLTPRADGYAPADLFFGRTPKGNLPGFRPIVVRSYAEAARRNAREVIRERDEALTLAPLKPGEKVVIQDQKSLRWLDEGVVLEKREDGRSYLVESRGKEFLRNRKFLKPIASDIHEDSPSKFGGGLPILRRSPRLASKA